MSPAAATKEKAEALEAVANHPVTRANSTAPSRRLAGGCLDPFLLCTWAPIARSVDPVVPEPCRLARVDVEPGVG